MLPLRSRMVGCKPSPTKRSWAMTSLPLLAAPLLEAGITAPWAHITILLVFATTGRRCRSGRWGRWGRWGGCWRRRRWRRWRPHTSRLRDPCLVVSSAIVHRIAPATPSPRSGPLDKPSATLLAHKWATAVSIACAGLLPIEGAEDTDHVVRDHI